MSDEHNKWIHGNVPYNCSECGKLRLTAGGCDCKMLDNQLHFVAENIHRSALWICANCSAPFAAGTKGCCDHPRKSENRGIWNSYHKCWLFTDVDTLREDTGKPKCLTSVNTDEIDDYWVDVCENCSTPYLLLPTNMCCQNPRQSGVTGVWDRDNKNWKKLSGPLPDQKETFNEGLKYDDGKVPIHLVSPEYIFATAQVLDFGAKKYKEWNWAKGMRWSRVFSALMRHMWAWWSGKAPTSKNFVFGELDAETQFSHLWHASCCLMFLLCYEEWGVGTDDRYTGETE